MSSELPLVSIVVPAYNARSYLPATIESLLAQDYPRLEILVHDDGSTDGTADVLAGYTDRIQWSRSPNKGQSATLNEGWARARGDLLGYLSADDLLAPAAVSTAVAAFAADPDLVLTYPDYMLIDARGEVLRPVQAPEFDYREMVLRLVCPPGPGALWRRSAWCSAGPWDPTLRQLPDYDFFLRLGRQGAGRRLPQVLAAFRVHQGSQTFGAAPADRSEEYPRVIARYFATQPVPPLLQRAREEALSNAYVYAARSHLRSGRYRTGLARAATALELHPRNAGLRTARILAHGLLNHVRYRRAAVGSLP